VGRQYRGCDKASTYSKMPEESMSADDDQRGADGDEERDQQIT